MHDGAAVDFPAPEKYVAPIAFNVIPLAGAWSTTAPAKPTKIRSCATRAARSWYPDLAVSGTCVRVPVFTGHSLSINAEFAQPISPERAMNCWPERLA